jgi:hypothetical protein
MKTAADARALAQQPEHREKNCGRELTQAERARRVREIYGRPPLEPVVKDEDLCAVETPPEDPVEFSRVKPDSAPGA